MQDDDRSVVVNPARGIGDLWVHGSASPRVRAHPQSSPKGTIRCDGQHLSLARGLLLAAATAGPASAITNGSPDGDLHLSVGAIVADWSSASPGPDVTCSGTLIDARVFLTVAHCTTFLVAGGHDIRVTFSPHYDEDAVAPTGLIAGAAVAHLCSARAARPDPNDIVVVPLAESPGCPGPAPVPDCSTSSRPTTRWTTPRSPPSATARRARTRPAGGTPGCRATASARHVPQQAHALLPSWLVLTSNAATGDGGTCYGDSVDPTSSAASTAPSWCPRRSRWTAPVGPWDQTYRLDTLTARAFLAQFVDLP